jgi:hypothetical protein
MCVSYTVRVTPTKGRGVFADAAIPRGAIVWRHVPGQYVVYDERSLKERLARVSHREAVYELTHVFGIPEFPGYMIRVLDAGVLINHSRQPTTVMNNGTGGYETPSITSARDVVVALLNDRFALIATRDLEIGDELTHDYSTGIEDPSYYDALCEQYEVSWSWL